MKTTFAKEFYDFSCRLQDGSPQNCLLRPLAPHCDDTNQKICNVDAISFIQEPKAHTAYILN